MLPFFNVICHFGKHDYRSDTVNSKFLYYFMFKMQQLIQIWSTTCLRINPVKPVCSSGRKTEMLTFIESKQHVTRPFCTSTCGGGWANLHSTSDLVHLFLVNSRQTSRVSHLESFTCMAFIMGLTMAIICTTYGFWYRVYYTIKGDLSLRLLQLVQVKLV